MVNFPTLLKPEWRVTRREFLKLAALVGASTVLSNYSVEIARALKQAFARNQVIILDGQACEGCAVSLLQGANPDLYAAVQLGTQLDFLIPITVEMGKNAAEKIDNFIEGPLHPKVLVVEGSVPMAENGLFETYWDYRENKRRPFTDLLKQAAGAADAIVAVGTAAAFGGIPRGSAQIYGYRSVSPIYGLPENTNPTGALGIADALKQLGVDVSKKVVPAVVNLPSCPVHPDHFFLTVVDLIYGNIPELDELGRPKAFYGRLIHDQCQYRGFFDRGEFLTSFDQYSGNLNDPFPTKPGEKGAGCFLLLGCKGPVTFNDCPTRKWNSQAEGVSWFNQSGVPCEGCANPNYPDSPTRDFYVPLSERIAILPKPPLLPTPPLITRTKSSGIFLGSVAAATALYALYAYATRRKKVEEEEKVGSKKE
ncbi:MAG: hydrogenase small subunit [Euryarchaeota archaeon]|nr:hydrogenase small subunit [Euryarchaeota archaeon]